MPPTIATTTHATKSTLRVPQARVLKALMPKEEDRAKHFAYWPTYNRVSLASRAGFIPTTGTINRVLNGIPNGSSSGEPHPGLLERGLMKAESLETDSGFETVYRITAAGIREVEAYLADIGRLPKKRDKELCVNDRYQE